MFWNARVKLQVQPVASDASLRQASACDVWADCVSAASQFCLAQARILHDCSKTLIPASSFI